jgi:hypothetical protein
MRLSSILPNSIVGAGAIGLGGAIAVLVDISIVVIIFFAILAKLSLTC